MIGLRSNFGLSLVLAGLAAVIGVVMAIVVGRRARAAGDTWGGPVARVLTVTAIVIVVVSTALPSGGISFDGDLVLELGAGGLDQWRRAFADPWTLSAIQLWSNVLLYVPVGFGFVFGWFRRRHLAPLVGLALSIAIEAVQFLLLGRVATIDDVLLNTGGALIGYGVALAVTPLLGRTGLGRA